MGRPAGRPRPDRRLRGKRRRRRDRPRGKQLHADGASAPPDRGLRGLDPSAGAGEPPAGARPRGQSTPADRGSRLPRVPARDGLPAHAADGRAGRPASRAGPLPDRLLPGGRGAHLLALREPDLGRLLAQAVRWLRGRDAPAVTVEGEGVVEAFAWETEPGYALHLLNYTNPNMTRGFVRRFYAIGPQAVRFEVAPGRTIGRVEALRSGRVLPFRQEGPSVRFEVPGVVDYEV